MTAAAAILFAFLCGSLPAGAWVARIFYRTDLRGAGSGNVGAANALRTLGRGAGAAVLFLDALKGFVPVLVARALGGDALALAAGFAAIAGHCYSPWLRFRGGKGVATELGVLFALSWPCALGFMLVWALALALTGFASVGSLVATALTTIPLGFIFGLRGAIYGVCVA
ncbi:MAG: glycerol-3-phosphate acyltransferase, partial [Candidatus Eremiobacteraeota bacterium]|nr:glycerol-3-phosphate acyltransferase [Candidatus Eremiobacteraeota bacterium]